jgi:hypothetical protein
MNHRYLTFAGSAVVTTFAALAALLGFVMGGSPDAAPTDPAEPAAAAAARQPASGMGSAPPGPDTAAGTATERADGGGEDRGGEDHDGGRREPSATGVGHTGPPPPSCEEGEFRVGEWYQPREGDAASLLGISADGGDDCVRVRIEFSGPAPGVRVWRYSALTETAIRFEPRPPGGSDVPYGPVSPDLIWPGSALLSTAMVTHDGLGLTVKAFHGSRTDLAARVVLADRHVDVFFRPVRSSDTRLADTWPGSIHSGPVTGLPAQGLAITYVSGSGSDGTGTIVVEGYAKAPESTVVLRVYQREHLACEQVTTALGPPYLFSYFGFSGCTTLRAGHYDVQVGWADPAGPRFDVWQWYEVSIG